MSATLEPAVEQPLTPPPAPPPPASEVPVLIIERRPGWRFFDLQELYAYRDLFHFLTWRMIKVRYAQSAIGIGWAIIQPLFTTLVFTVVFGRLARVDSEGQPYLLFSFAAMVPWTYFANSLTEGANSLVQSADMISKVYFPRVILPLSAVAAKLLDFAIAFLILLGLMFAQGVWPNAGILLLPLFILLMMATAAGLGMWLTALAIQYRDVKHALGFVVQLLMYAAPVVYPTSAVPTRWQLVGGLVLNPQYLYALNPMVAVIEGFRSALLGTRPIPWDFLALGCLSAGVIFLTGGLYFRSKERLFADVA